MTEPAPEPVLPVWFFDTSSLMTMAVDADLRAVVRSTVGDAPVVLLDVVVSELEHRAKQDGPMSQAAAALTQLDWLGEPVNTARAVTVADIVEIQTLVADGRVLKDPREHWAESTAIAMMKRSREVHQSTRPKKFLAEDHSARVHADKEPTCTPWSIHRLLWEQVQCDELSADEAERLCGVIQEKTGGAVDCSAADFSNTSLKGLGRVGRP